MSRKSTIGFTETFAVHLIREGLWREAIHLYKEETGSSTAQAEHAIELMAMRHGVHRFSRSFFIAIIASLGISLIIVAGLLQWLA